MGTLQSQFDSILSDPKLSGAVVSACVCREDGSIVYEHNSTTHVVPASNQKLLSSTFALYTLGPEYKPSTKFWKLPTRLYVQTTGDPLMTYGQLTAAKESLRVDPRSLVQVNEPYAPGFPGSWELDDLPNKYAAPVTAFTVDRGSFEIWWKGGKVVALPSSYGVRIIPIGGAGSPQVDYDPFRAVAQVSGKMPAADARLDTLSIREPDAQAAFLFGKGFQRTEEAPPASAPDYAIEGKPLIDIIGACLPVSDNNIAENLLLMGARRQGDLGPNPYVPARQRLSDFLTHVVGIDPTEIHAYDGSGMSRHDFVTTHAICQLLTWENGQPTAAAYRAALAHSGEKGTLSRRLQGLKFDGKTGTLDMVAALSGYVRSQSGGTLIVSVIVNEFGCRTSEAQAVMDTFVKAVATSDLPPTIHDRS